jgi:hypothetical protein
MPEHILFAVGFALLAVILFLVFFFRAVQLARDLPNKKGLKIMNIVALSIGWLGCPFLIVMGAIPDSSSAGIMHFVGAGIAMGCFALSLISTAAVSLAGSSTCDRWLPRAVRICLYVFSAILALVALVLFVYWMMGNQDQTILEWLGVVLLFVGFGPDFVFFARYRRRDSEEGETTALVK